MKLYYVTFPDPETAERIGRMLVEERTAACVNTVDSRSCYRWDGAINEQDEVVAYIKTADDHAERLVDRLQELHPYDVPCILDIGTTATPEYADWVEDELH